MSWRGPVARGAAQKGHELNMKLLKVGVVLSALVASLLALAPVNAKTIARPIVEGPITAGIHGRPWESSLVPLAPHGFVEKEYFLSGTSGDLPFKTRMVVRRPRKASDFSGTVFVEWVNVTGGRDLETLWPAGHDALLNEGHAYVVVSAQLVGHSELRAWDPVRYGTLTHPGDSPGSFNIFQEALEAVRFGGAKVDPMGDLDVDYVIATGDSQSAGRLTTYITDGYRIKGLIDGFLPGRGGGNEDTGKVAAKLRVPMLWLLEENQAERPADTKWQKFWYQAGAAHAPMDWAHYVWRSDMRDLAGTAPVPDAVNAGCSVNRAPGHAVRAGVHWIDQWVRAVDGNPRTHGGVAPSGPRLKRDADGELLRDKDGHARGGIRYPYIEAPIAVNSSEVCPLFGNFDPFSSAEILARYSTHADYVAAVRKAADKGVRQGFLLRRDRRQVLFEATSFDVWSDGAATCYDLRAPVERLHYDSTWHPCPPS